MTKGMDLAHGLLARVRDCRKRRRWPGRYQGEQELVLPSVLYATDDDELELVGLKEKA